MDKQKGALGIALASGLGLVTGAEGAVYEAALTNVVSYSPNGSVAGALTSSTATWRYDDETGLLNQAGGVLDVRFALSPTTTLFRHTITGLVIGAGAPATAESYVCTEGNFGLGVNASLCGNYRFGTNFLNESTATWGPGTAYSRTLGGDDTFVSLARPPPQNITAYDGFAEQDLSGVTLTLSNASCVVSEGELVCIGGYDWVLTLNAASPDSASTAANTPTAPIDVLANDPGVNDPVTLSVLAAPDQGGSVAILDGGSDCADPCTGNKADLRLVLTPSSPSGSAAYAETFTYQVSDGAATASATVTVDVAAAPAPPEDEDSAPATARDGAGGSALDVALLSFLLGSALLRRRRR